MAKVKTIALFMDGEPTLHKKLTDFLIYAKELGIKVLLLISWRKPGIFSM